MDNALLVGDYHSNVTFPVDRGQSFESFVDQQEKVFAAYRAGLQPLAAVFGTYPEMSDEQRQLDQLYNINPLVKFNYLGEIAGKRLAETVQGLTGMWASLRSFRGSRLYATAFSVGATAYVGFPRFPIVRPGLIESFGLTIVRTEDLAPKG
jgi:hypothetical protein